MGEHEYCRLLLSRVMKDVAKRTTEKTRKESWAYRANGMRTAEFHIDRCEQVPEGFYWHGQACCLWLAKAKGWMAFMDKEVEK